MERQKVLTKIGFTFCLFVVTMLGLLFSGRPSNQMRNIITNDKTFISSYERLTDEMKSEFADTVRFEDEMYTLLKVDQESEINKKEPYSHTVERLVMTKDEVNPESTMQLNINGESVTVYLKDITYEESPVTGRTTNITDFEEYKDLTSEPKNVPKTKEVKYTDEYTGKTISVNLELSGIQKISDPVWKEDLKEEFTVEGYGADYYDMSGHPIPHTEERPDFTGKEDLLYKRFELDKKSNVIQSIAWKGEPYTKNGVLCRDVLVTGKRLVGTWKAKYINDNVSLPDATGYKAYINYESKTSLTEVEYKIHAVAYYERVSNYKYYVLGVAGIYIAVILFLIVKYKKKLCSNGEE